MNDKIKYKVLLWDIDGTILNFKAAEKEAIRMGFRNYHLGECTDEMIARYSVINDRYWREMELGRTTKEALLIDRFMEFFEKEGIRITRDTVVSFNDDYQLDLGETIVFNDGADALLRDLKGKVLQYAVTNGNKVTQEKKFARSGLLKILDGAFISEEVGAEKPRPEFFEAVFRALPEFKKEDYLVIGDSLTADMFGANNAHLACCWYNPKERAGMEELRIDYEIRSLREIPGIIGEGN
ncbi:MAG: YjjG family noncanonical pyrimidine nucleotidase [Lachnospiraceae bacterium]|nr:YjjG family noncanonical pyrimidine nucleotidase [Lachnospiraceae bacterium]